MAELTERDKLFLADQAVRQVAMIAKLHKLDFATLPQAQVQFMIDVFIGGATFAIEGVMKMKQEQKP